MASTDDPPGDSIAYTGAELKAARQRAHLSQTALGRKVGGSQRGVTRWESEGIRRSSHHLAAVEQVLGLGDAPPDPNDLTRRSTLDLIALLHAIAGELAARHLREVEKSAGGQPDVPELPGEPFRIPRAIDPHNGVGHGEQDEADGQEPEGRKRL